MCRTLSPEVILVTHFKGKMQICDPACPPTAECAPSLIECGPSPKEDESALATSTLVFKKNNWQLSASGVLWYSCTPSCPPDRSCMPDSHCIPGR